jgi:hypothetical protein
MINLDCLNCGAVTAHKSWGGPAGWHSFRVCRHCGSEGVYSVLSNCWVDFYK